MFKRLESVHKSMSTRYYVQENSMQYNMVVQKYVIIFCRVKH